MKVFRYPLRSLIGDYLRSLVGLAVGLGILITVPSSPAILIIFGGLTVLFLVFGLRTLQRQILRIAITDDDICSAHFSTRVLPWRGVKQVKLRYYGTRRSRSQEDSGSGFMELTLGGTGTSVKLESSIEGFAYIAWRAAKAARENRVSLDPTSAGNLLDIGIDADADRPAPTV